MTRLIYFFLVNITSLAFYIYCSMLFLVVYDFLFISYLLYFTEYTDDEAQIQKHSSVIVRRIPIGGVKSAGRTYVVYVYFTKCFLFAQVIRTQFTCILLLSQGVIWWSWSLVCVSAEIVQTQLWWDLLDPYVKQTQKLTHTSHSSSPLPSAFNHLPKNILSNTIQLCVPSVHCVFTFVLRAQFLCDLMSQRGILRSYR